MLLTIRSRLSELTVALTLLLITVSAFSDDSGGYVAEWESRRGEMECFNVLGFPSELLPAGIEYLDLLIVGEHDESSELAVIGYGSYTVYFGTVPFDMFLNPAKTVVQFQTDDSLIIVSSEYPFRATRYNSSYRWMRDEQELVPFASWISDRSEDLLASADSLLEIGEIRAAADSISMMMYGFSYYESSELCCRFLRAAHRASSEARGAEALRYYDEVIYAFEVIQYDDTWFISFDSLEDFQGSDYAEYIEAEELADILHDYAKLFRDNDFMVEAIFDDVADILEGKEIE
jgi:hypothetical protein